MKSDLHEVGDEEVVLQSRHSFLRQDGRLATDRAGERQRLWRDVVLETAGGGRGQRMRSWRRKSTEDEELEEEEHRG